MKYDDGDWRNLYMDARDFNIGKRIKNIETDDILEVIELNGEKVWECEKWGDIYGWVDEDLYVSLN